MKQVPRPVKWSEPVLPLSETEACKSCTGGTFFLKIDRVFGMFALKILVAEYVSTNEGYNGELLREIWKPETKILNIRYSRRSFSSF